MRPHLMASSIQNQQMPFDPLVSIVIPVYNGANFMREAINSALAQTYPKIEVLVINDGSNDCGKTEDIARSYGDRIRYFHKANGGCASALNTGIANMRGDFFSWLSHDDVYFPEKIEHQIKVLQCLDDRGSILYGGWEVIDSESKTTAVVRLETLYSRKQLDSPLFALLRGKVHGCTLLVPVRHFRQVGVFDETLLTTQDYALWFEMFRKAPVHFDSRILVKSRAHPDQGTFRMPNHVQECNDLWSGFLKQLTDDEMVEMEGARYRFLRNTSRFLASTPYDQALGLAIAMAEGALSGTLISVVVPILHGIDKALESIQSLQAQTHNHLEIILVLDGSTPSLSNPDHACMKDPRIRWIDTGKPGILAALNSGAMQAKGQFIAFLMPGDIFDQRKLEEQLCAMEDESLILTCASHQTLNQKGMGLMDEGIHILRRIQFLFSKHSIIVSTLMIRNGPAILRFQPEPLNLIEVLESWTNELALKNIFTVRTALSYVRIRDSLRVSLSLANHQRQAGCLSGFWTKFRMRLPGKVFGNRMVWAWSLCRMEIMEKGRWLHSERRLRHINRGLFSFMPSIVNCEIFKIASLGFFHPIVAYLDPIGYEIMASATLRISGWAFSNAGPVARIDVILNDLFIGTLVYGITRIELKDNLGNQWSNKYGFDGHISMRESVHNIDALVIRVVDVAGYFCDLKIT